MARTVLIAEPHAPTLELLQHMLAQAGYRVLAADEPGRALEACVSERPDAVLLAADLPRYQGSTLGKLLRATESGTRLPLLAVDKGHLGKARGVGSVLDLMVNAYLADATKRDEILGRLDQLISAAAVAPRPTTGVAATLGRSPVASGEMKSRALPSHLHSWYRLARDGVLVFAHRELTRRVYFVRGAPANYDSSARQDSLASWLGDRGIITEAQHQELLSMVAGGELSPGAALVAIGAVEAGEPLLALLRDWARAKISQALAMSEGRFSFYAGDEFASEVPSIDLPALAPIYEAVRLSWPTKSFASALGPHMKEYPARSPDFARELPALGLSTADLSLALSLTGQRTLREVLADSKDLKHALALLWYLSTVQVLSYSPAPRDAGSQSGVALPAQPASRKRRKALPAAKAAELGDEAVKILTASYFRALGLDITAGSEEVERAYHDAATRFHPDSYAEFELGPMGDLLASVLDKLSAAYRVLSDEAKRKAYVSFLLGRAEVARAETPNVEAEVELKRGENLMRKGDWSGALTAFERAVSLNAREPEYYSYLAWATFKAGPGDAAHRAKSALKLIKKALAINPTLERPQIIAAIIEDEIGDPAEARKLLFKLLKSCPGCLLAKKVLQGINRRRGAGEKA